jgi:cytidylate kinase
MIITIDGPAGTGKSSVSQQVARRLGYAFLDTGAMYRAVALEALRREIDLDNVREVAFAARHAGIEFDWSVYPPGVVLNGEPVTHLLRSAEVTSAASRVAVVPAVREMLVGQQRRIGNAHGNIVTEGRDQGSIVFPGAQYKFYLDATPAERARRRAAQLRARGEIVDVMEIQRQMEDRDARDTGRAVGPLAVPKDAHLIDTTSMSEQQVIERIISIVQQKGGARP